MTKYSESTPITPELLAGAIALELQREPRDWERIRLYARVHDSMLTPDD